MSLPAPHITEREHDRFAEAVDIAIEHVLWRQRSRSGGTSYCYARGDHLVREDFGLVIRHDGQAKRVAIAIYAAEWLNLGRVE
jgi:hypothetical protein